MKWKMTGRFLMTVMSIIFIVIIANTAMLIFLLITQSRSNFENPVSSYADDFVRNMSQYIEMDGEQPILTAEGEELLKERNAWLQILNTDGDEVNAYFTPSSALTHYSPIDIIQHYKYQEHDAETTVFISNYENYSYLVGIKDADISRTIISMNISNVVSIIAKYLLWIIVIDIFIALIVGLIFGSILTKPLYIIVERIQKLTNNDYTHERYKRQGIYKKVFKNLEDVSNSLSTQEAERKKLEKMRTEWISNVSHDLKTPLSSIQGYAELLKESTSEEERQAYADIIENKSIYMRELLDDFNLTMRLRNAELPLQLTAVKMESFMREIIIDLLNNPQFENRDIAFESSTSNLQVSIDQLLMQRALTNIITNAFIHNDVNTAITIALSEDSAHYEILISDNGKGISEGDLEQIFERYYRGSNTSNIQGTGLGTAIARDIIEAHHGKISVESSLNIGTSFRISLPK